MILLLILLLGALVLLAVGALIERLADERFERLVAFLFPFSDRSRS